MDLQDLVVSGYDSTEGFDGDINVQFLDGVGRTSAMYFWIDIPADEEDPDSVAFYGWYDGNDELAVDVNVKAGTALWTKSDSSIYSLVFPGVEVK